MECMGFYLEVLKERVTDEGRGDWTPVGTHSLKRNYTTLIRLDVSVLQCISPAIFILSLFKIDTDLFGLFATFIGLALTKKFHSITMDFLAWHCGNIIFLDIYHGNIRVFFELTWVQCIFMVIVPCNLSTTQP